AHREHLPVPGVPRPGGPAAALPALQGARGHRLRPDTARAPADPRRDPPGRRRRGGRGDGDPHRQRVGALGGGQQERQLALPRATQHGSGGGGTVRITKVVPWLVRAPGTYWGEFFFVEVRTDEGVSGWGEVTTTTPSANRAVAHMVRQVDDLVAG